MGVSIPVLICLCLRLPRLRLSHEVWLGTFPNDLFTGVWNRVYDCRGVKLTGRNSGLQCLRLCRRVYCMWFRSVDLFGLPSLSPKNPRKVNWMGQELRTTEGSTTKGVCLSLTIVLYYGTCTPFPLRDSVSVRTIDDQGPYPCWSVLDDRKRSPGTGRTIVIVY